MHTHNAPGARAAQREQMGPAASVTENAVQAAQNGACAAAAEGAAGAMPEKKRAPGAQSAKGQAQPAQAPGGVQQQRQAAARAQETGAQAGDGPKACVAEAEGAAGATPEERQAPGAQAAGGQAAACPAGAAPMPAEGAQAHGAQGCGRAKLWPLFLATLYISTFTFGGGFVIVTFMKRKFVDSLKWLSEEEMLDFAALAQASPGAIAVNAAILVGWRVCGPAGMAVAVLGTILPPMVILSVVSLFYAAFAANRWVALALKGMQAGVAAVILDVACGLGAGVARERSALSLALMAGAFLASFVFGVNVIFIILAAALAGVGKTLWHKRKGAGAP